MTGGVIGAGILQDESATVALAARLADVLRAGDAVLLFGDLGAGKSTFARALIRARAGLPDLEVPSPTFTLVQVYELADLALYHYDLYRIGEPEEVEELGFSEAVATGAVLVEWPERLGRWRPASALGLRLAPASELGPEARTVELSGSDAWMERAAGILG